jgi:hypothetical protein
MRADISGQPFVTRNQERIIMKKFTIVAALALGLTAMATAADFKGFIQDTDCAGKPAMKGDADCSRKCIKSGSPAVLVMPDGKIYKIANQDKVVAHAGENVTISGTVKDDTITVASVK